MYRLNYVSGSHSTQPLYTWFIASNTHEAKKSYCALLNSRIVRQC